MKREAPLALRIFGRLSLGLVLLCGLCLALGIQTRLAHAQAANTLTVTDCTGENGSGQIGDVLSSASSGDTITFSCSGAIPLSSTLTINTNNLTIDGSGQTVTLDGQNQVGVLYVSKGITLTLNNLTITNGGGSFVGAGIHNYGTVTISNSTVSNSTAQIGGGLYSEQGTSVTVTNSTFSGNSASYGGGGLENDGATVNISNSTFSNNTGGGGLLNTNSGTTTITNSTFSGNQANGADIEGGGFYNNVGATLKINDSTVTGNSASYGGGLSNEGTVTVTNSTFSGNSAGAAGGALDNESGSSLTVTNSTIASNTAGTGSGLFNENSTASFTGSIVAENSGGSNCFLFNSTTNDNGYNLDSDSSCFTASTSLHTNPQLSTLANNGGPTQTMALQQGSPAIDQVPLANCPSTDQRGDPRPDVDTPAETACDMGAYESAYVAVDDDLGLSNMPSNITTKATSPSGATVTYTSPTVVDEDNPLPPVNCSPASGSTFVIGTTTVTCTVTDSDDSNSPVIQSFTVTVNPVLTLTVPATSKVTEGATKNGILATGKAYGVPSPLTATIHWGDGSTPTVLSVPVASDGSYSITSGHAYLEEGNYTLSVHVTDSQGMHGMSKTSAVTVSDAALKFTSLSKSVSGLTATTTSVFTDADPNGTVSDYSASINWGDGNTTPATVAVNSNGSGFTTQGSHTYASHGSYTVTLTVSDAGGSTISKSTTITV